MADIFARSNKPIRGSTFNSPGRTQNPFGVFVGFVKENTDVQRMGRLRVWIPEFGSLPDDEDSWITVNYCSPFAGATNPDTEDRNNTQSFEGTQTSYGMWMIPPDLENQVLVMFINGDTAKGIWIGSMFQQYMNHMIPSTAASKNNYQYGAQPGSAGHIVPSVEYNKWDTSVDDPQAARRPYSKTKFRGVSNQGLINDPIRGTSTTSARREAPSEVYGILTPGPLQKDTTTKRRTGGSSFVMDDGKDSEYVQLATKSGAQIRIDESNGLVFIINRDGTSWVQMDKDGNIDIFGAGNLSMRSQKDVNIRADRNINIEAGQNLYLKAAKDTQETTSTFTYDVNGTNTTKTIPFWQYKGEGNGDGGNIVMQANNNLQSTISNNAFMTVKNGGLSILANSNIYATSNTGGVEVNSNKGIKVTSGASLDIGITGKIRVNASGNISLSSESQLTLCSNGKTTVNSSSEVVINGGSSVKVGAPSTVINSGNTSIGGGTVDLAPPSMPAPGVSSTPETAQSATQSKSAEVKPLNDKINILPTWDESISQYPTWAQGTGYRRGNVVSYDGVLYMISRDTGGAANTVPPPESSLWSIFISDDKFTRKSESLQTTISRLPTYEPCPEHTGFKLSSVNGYVPPVTGNDTAYVGSSGKPGPKAPVDSTNPTSANTDVMGDDLGTTTTINDVNITILRSQLAINEGLRYTVYKDTLGYLTAGFGHLLTSPNEVSIYNLGTPIPSVIVDKWFTNDTSVAVRGAIRTIGTPCWDGLNDVRRRALVDLSYNLGEAGLSGFKGFIASMRNFDFTGAGNELRDSLWFKQVGVRGPRIVQMVITGEDPVDWVGLSKNIIPGL